MAPRISLVMPTYNGMKFLPAAVSSVLEQEFQDWELIISDDGSKDETRAYLDTLTDPRIVVFKQEKNLGIFGNLNFLFSQARAPITQIFCQDDKLTAPSSLATILTLWDGLGAEVGFLRCNHMREFTTSHRIRFEGRVLPLYPRLVTPEASDFYFLAFGCIPGNLSNVSLRTHLVAQNGGYDQSLPYAGDFEFWSRIGRKYPWGISNVEVVHVREHDGQASKTLNYKGELLAQLESVVASVSSRLSARQIPSAELKMMATLNIVGPQFYVALKRLLLSGDTRYIKTFYSVYGRSQVTFNNAMTTVLCLLSLGGKLGSVSLSDWFLKKYIPRQNAPSGAGQ